MFSSLRRGRAVALLGAALVVAVPGVALPGLAAPAAGASATATPAARPVVLRLTTTVERGDSPARIARRYGVAMADLLRINGLTARSVLRPGMRLRIPDIVVPAPLVARLPRMLLVRPERLRLVPVFTAAARQAGVPADLLMALAYRESNWNPQARSRSGAMGVGQLMPTTVDYVNTRLVRAPVPLDPWNPADNILMSAQILRHFLNLTGGDARLALAAYYQGFGSLTRQGVLPVGERYAASVLALRPSFRTW
jgi:soluble lytic murein transglycosylase-like protein